MEAQTSREALVSGGAEATEDLGRLLAPLLAISVLDVENVGKPLRDKTADGVFRH